MSKPPSTAETPKAASRPNAKSAKAKRPKAGQNAKPKAAFKAALKTVTALEAAKLVAVVVTKTADSAQVFIDGVGLPEGTDRVNLAVGGHRLRLKIKGDAGKTWKVEIFEGQASRGSVSATVMQGLKQAWSAERPFNV
jgi:hypothetical protein